MAGNAAGAVIAAQATAGWAGFLLVGGIGGLLGACELLTRYRDEPVKAVCNWAALTYIAVNFCAAVLALFLIETFHVDFGVEGDPAKLTALRVLAAGLAAMAFFRTSLFTAKVGDQDLPLGPGIILQILLNVTDRQVDRGRARPRAQEIADQVNLIEQPKPGEASRLQSILLGLLLLNVVGAEVLKAAIAAIKQDVQAPPPPPASA
ncbi:MAG: hypothetical protein ACJ8EB_06440 [Allosphingosinicella sp.]